MASMTPLPSSEAKSNIVPIARLEKKPKAAKGLKRSQMERKPSKLKRGTVGKTSTEQKEKVLREGARIDHMVINLTDLIEQFPDGLGPIDPAHIIARAQGGCDDEDCICPLPRRLHDAYDEGKLDLLPWLTLDEQAHAVKHVGILGALKRTTGESYVPERLLRVASDDRETS
jgi:hypothetical protein